LALGFNLGTTGSRLMTVQPHRLNLRRANIGPTAVFVIAFDLPEINSHCAKQKGSCMSHFYRLLTRDNSHWAGRPYLGSVYMSDFNKSALGSVLPIPGEETQLAPPIPGLALLSVSYIPKNEERAYLVGSGKNEMPDIIGWGGQIIVSDKAKAIIKEFDDFPHQFYETKILTDTPRVAAIDGDYHVLMVRRVLECVHPAEITRDIKRRYPYFFASSELSVMKIILDSEQIKSQVAQIPIWRFISGGGHYLSEGLVAAMKNAGLTGLVDYTDDAKSNESIVLL
jgi:hypothetical protein